MIEVSLHNHKHQLFSCQKPIKYAKTRLEFGISYHYRIMELERTKVHLVYSPVHLDIDSEITTSNSFFKVSKDRGATKLIPYLRESNCSFFFFNLFIYFFYFTISYWFFCTSTCIRHGCTRVPDPEPPSHLPPHTIPLKLEPIIQSEVSQKEKHQYSILTHIYGI